MPAYFIAQLQIHDRETYREYATKVGSTVAGYGGGCWSRRGAPLIGAGSGEGRDAGAPRRVIGEFPSLEQEQVWYESAEG